MPITPVVAIFSNDPLEIQDIKLKSSNHIDWESHDFECHFFSDKDDLNSIITKLNPAVFITT